MPPGPVPRDPGRDEDPRPVPGWPDWMDDPAYLARETVLLASLGLTAATAAEVAAAAGRRGPGMPGSAARVPGVSVSRAAGFASGMPLDVAPGCLELARFAEDAAGSDDRYPGASDDEVAGVIAEFIRRRPAPGCQPEGPARMPEAADEFAVRELAAVLGEACVAEAKVLDRAGTLTPPGLRAAIARAVMEVAPGKATRRREHEAKKARVERWVEASGNAGLAGRELPPAQVLAADQRVTAWARELREAGVEGGMDALRARAFLDIVLGMDSRPLGSTPGGAGTPQVPAWGPSPVPAGGPLAGVIPPGFAGHVTLTIPEATLTRGADRPGELGGIGPVDPDPGANTWIMPSS